MTRKRENIDQIPDVIRDCHDMDWRLFAHQPAACAGNPKRWSDDFRELTNELV